MKQDVLTFDGFVSNVQYTACLAEKLPEYDFCDFDINKARPCGKIIVPDGSVAYSKWVSPKRTRSYPFARLYDILNAPKRITVIPVLKDEGIDGDLDRIQFSTISWMNLFDIYIVLAYYESAVRNSRAGQSKRNKISKQSFSPDFVERQILDILKYKNSALHWNFNLLETSFVDIYRKALDSYQVISRQTGIKMHDRKAQEKYLEKVRANFDDFKNLSLSGSKNASIREAAVVHHNEHLSDGSKVRLNIRNYLGGVYYLTADEVIKEGDRYVIQESKNSTKGSLPSLDDIKDGLFKIALFSNIDALLLEGQKVDFTVRLKLTGKDIYGTLFMPCSSCELDRFITENRLNERRAKVIRGLYDECLYNKRIQIHIAPNQ
ncbi:hypothetical protein [Roseiflexus sp. RS-1]|jgi:hypothetical protein|uniref:hypothetical protein n=1 Tax=Roseiflexus sp. (strain RS-1) TaxID=357808 RepID=UPI0000D7FFAF|nr:hypothetical protein [Roseiflexus sp. RS-1]ABQ91408.1 hypothetical protein RoseRS_3044 [Roseiflexus sp. RS-1]